MAKILKDVSRTFNEFLLLPNLTDERCIPSNVSLKTPLVKFKKVKNQNIMRTFRSYQLLCKPFQEKRWLLLWRAKEDVLLFLVHNR